MIWAFLAMSAGFFWWGPSSWYRRGRGAAGAFDLPAEVRVRLEAVDQLEARVAELESRHDFAERLLAERRSADLGSPSR